MTELQQMKKNEKLELKLHEVLKDITIEDSDSDWEDLEATISKKLKCEVELFDGNDFADEWGCDIIPFGAMVADAIGRHVQNNITAVASGTIDTEDDNTILVVVMKTK